MNTKQSSFQDNLHYYGNKMNIFSLQQQVKPRYEVLRATTSATRLRMLSNHNGRLRVNTSTL